MKYLVMDPKWLPDNKTDWPLTVGSNINNEEDSHCKTLDSYFKTVTKYIKRLDIRQKSDD
jgi:hypothetical protein